MNLTAADMLRSLPRNDPRRKLILAQLSDTSEAAPVKRRNKYNATRTQVDGIWFDSKHEAEIHGRIKLMATAGPVLWFIRQPMFDLPGGIIYRGDFLLVMEFGSVKVVDAKSPGTMTKEFKLKRRLMREAYPYVDIELW